MSRIDIYIIVLEPMQSSYHSVAAWYICAITDSSGLSASYFYLVHIKKGNKGQAYTFCHGSK